MSEKGFVLDKFREFNNKIAELEDQFKESEKNTDDWTIKVDKKYKELEQIIENLNLDYDMINGNRKGIEKLEKQMLLKADVEKVYKIKSVLTIIANGLTDYGFQHHTYSRGDVISMLDGEKEVVVQKSAEIGDTPENSTVGCRQHSKPSEPSDEDRFEKGKTTLKSYFKEINKKQIQKLIDEFLEDLKKLPRESITWEDMPGGKAHKSEGIEFGKIGSYVVHHRDINILKKKWEKRLKE